MSVKILLLCDKNNKKRAKNIADQLHKKFTSAQIKSLIESYIRKEIELSYIISDMNPKVGSGTGAPLNHLSTVLLAAVQVF